jgi:hypothetical protein
VWTAECEQLLEANGFPERFEGILFTAIPILIKDKHKKLEYWKWWWINRIEHSIMWMMIGIKQSRKGGQGSFFF